MNEIIEQFDIPGNCTEIKPYGNGHIHDTYLVETLTNNETRRFILQRLNTHVFPNPPNIMENILRVTSHIREKLEKEGFPLKEIDRRVLRIIPTRNSESYYIDPGQNYWRVYRFIERTCSYDTLQTPEQLYQVAAMFGTFLHTLRDFPQPPLHDTIPLFHDGPSRFQTFKEVLEADTCNRAHLVKEDIDFILQNASMFQVIPRLVSQKKIPTRVTHNDTKINNILLDRTTHEGMCVIDLDTVMPGVSLYDFGDLARTTLSVMGEDEPDLSRVFVEIDRFEVILKGFLHGTHNALNPEEIKHLVASTRIMTLLIGMRFFTDYLSGDRYFKIHRPQHNLDRARRQFQLVRSIIQNEDTMNELVQRYTHSLSF